ncbi:protein translocase subunit SecD [Patescibacteria group bacterium]|nr:protein translocase subunit SecD [Patescibacteria group bacterium]
MERNKIWTIFVFIIALAVLSLLIDIPQLPEWVPGNKWFSKQKIHLGLDLQGGAQLTYQMNLDDIPSKDRASSIDGVRDVIERRVNVWGVSEPVVQTANVGNSWRLLVELPGIKDVNKAIAMIGETPILEFKEQAPVKEITAEEKQAVKNFNEEVKVKADQALVMALKGEQEFSELVAEFSQEPGADENKGVLDWFKKGVMLPEFEKVVFEDLKVGEITQELVETQFGYHIIKKIDERTNEDGELEAKASHILFFIQSEQTMIKQPEWNYTGLTGKQLKRAYVTFNSQTNDPEISLEFNKQGTKLFGEITTRNVDKPVAIFLDNIPLSIPTVREPITTGMAVITGKFALKEAKQLSQRLVAGALPVPIELIGQQNIGPSLGKISVQESFVACLLGFLIIIIFMISFYRFRGLLASFALLIYALIVMALFKLIPVTLTLAGVAGFILSLGMAVDANILIFERLKDEERIGKHIFAAIDDGVAHAWTAIRDSNITTLIVCFILYSFGTGLVKGFGLTLGIGVLVSMFTAIVVTKTFLKLTAREHD